MNVLWIITTQWRAQACGYAGNHDVTTPALDALAARAVNFSQAVTPHPFGPFARAALLTGVESPKNGIRDYFDPLPVESQTIAHEMKARGFLTAYFGKWHLAKRDPNASLVGEAHARLVVAPESRGGFEFWEGFESGFLLNDPWLHGTRLPVPTRFRGYQSDVLCERAGEWILEADRQPWFCVVSLEPPHPPYDQAPVWTGRSRPEQLVLPPNVPRGGPEEKRARRELLGYYAHIAATDRAIDRLLDRIDFSTTAVIVASVHGDMHGAHGLFRKGWPHEESVRVPLLAAIPGVAPKMSRACVSLAQLPALTVGLADRSDLAYSEKRYARISMPSVVALPDQCDRAWRGVRSAERKLILTEGGLPWLFFNLEKDPFEQENLVGKAEWESEIQRWTAEVDGP